MSIRPADLQQVVLKSMDVTRDTAAAQQQAIAAQDTLAGQLQKRHSEQAETVQQQLDDPGAAAVHEREQRGRQQQAFQQEGRQPEADQAPLHTAPTPVGLPKPRVGRHIDVQA